MKNRICLMSGAALVAAVATAALLGGCASVKPMAVTADAQSLDLTKESVVLVAMRVGNNNRTAFQPESAILEIAQIDGAMTASRFAAGEPYNTTPFNDYLVSMSLAPGKYKLRTVYGQGGAFPFKGTYVAPVYTTFEVPARAVVYIGRMEAIIQNRTTDEELRAGPVLPVIPQVNSGFSNGTFVIKMSDNFTADMAQFSRNAPVLKKYKVERRIMPAWRQPTDKDME